jgi:alpha-tubulin suppressor-like RCC1 family protein/DNA-directed RNA polymerase subunit RPC12/RpoP
LKKLKISKQRKEITFMAVIKCKICGGDLELTPNMTVAECEYCGTKQTVPTIDNEKKITLFGRANRLRFACEFDKAASVYESIVVEFPEEAEAYWGLVLCKYGIEYVDDPATGKKVPTCHRSSYDSVMDDSDFEQTVENADVAARRLYREEAKTIEELRKEILEVSGKEEPYDIFICYKEKDENGQRTIDSVMAQDVYEALTEKGYRVFFSRISLEDKLGQEYEPYIFAALNSSKIMLAFGTDYEYFNAVWVKNEWSRFLKLMTTDKTKHLIPCYKGIDVYDMPKEFAKLQAQDLGKVGATQDLLRGIEKILGRKTVTEVIQTKETVVIQQADGFNTLALLKRGYMALEDGDWDKAAKFFDDALNIDAECAEAYWGNAMIQWKWHTKDEYAKHSLIDIDILNDKNFQRAYKFANKDLKLYFAKLWECRKNQLARREREEEEKRRNIPHLTEVRERLKAVAGRISCSNTNTVGLKADGTVIAIGNNEYGQCNVLGWNDVVAISAGYYHTVGLKSDGNVVAVGGISYATIWDVSKGQCSVSHWHDIVAISAGYYHTVGLKSDGTVVDVGNDYNGQCDVSDWNDVVAISAGYYYTVGLKSDGTVIDVGNNNNGQCDVSDWDDIVAISVGDYYTVGLKSDGTVVAVGSNSNGQCDVSDWHDMVAISAGHFHTVGLKSDGTVVAVGSNDNGQCDVSDWRDIVAISAGGCHTVGLKSDGTLLAVGDNKCGQCNISGWRLFDSLDVLNDMDALEKEKRKGTERVKEATRLLKEARENLKLVSGCISSAKSSDWVVGLKSDGMLQSVDNEYNIPWDDIISVSIGGDYKNYIVGLKSDGDVVVRGKPYTVSDWHDIVAISAGNKHTVGLKSDGTVVAVVDNYFVRCNVSDWHDIVAISAGNKHTVGLKSDGTVVATGVASECNVSTWSDIVSISCGCSYTIGLKSDGTVVVAGINSFGQCDVSDWHDIVAVSAGYYYTVGLKSDGTVVKAGHNENSQIECDVSDWHDIVDVTTGKGYIIGLKSDGTVVKTGEHSEINWKLFDDFDVFKEERKWIVYRRERIRQNKDKIEQLESELAELVKELNNLKGFFTGKRRKEIDERRNQIFIELKKLS